MNAFSLWEKHLENFIQAYSKDFFWTVDNFLSPSLADYLLTYAKDNKESFQPAKIGKGNLKQRKASVRSDSIMWLENFESPEEILVKQIFDSLKIIIRKEFYLPAKRFECHFAKYEPGSFYKVHQDRHQNKPGRLVSCVLYLNQCDKNAGNLVIYDEELRPIRIKPSPGKIVVFDSSLEHEVTPTKSDRWSLTGWIRDDINPGLRI